jgi:hypothetical protein
VSDELDNNVLAELSRHYDAMLWTVTAIWSTAIGGLLIYTHEHFYSLIAVFGLGFTICAMYFAFSFRVLRRKVHSKMADSDLKELLVAGPGLHQWDVLAIIFSSLVFFWGCLLILHACRLWPLWLSLSMGAEALVVIMWCIEHPRRKPNA